MSSLRIFLKFLLVVVLLGTATVGGLVWHLSQSLPDVSQLRDIQLQTPMLVYSADGKVISQFGEKRRIPLRLEQMPKTLVHAILATEDSRFYEHPGIDLIGMGRAFVNLIMTGKKGQGGGTITMQVARNFFLTREKTYTRKLKEVLLAWRIEQLLTKDEILELYLNKIPLGYRAYGVGAAAQVYYGKDVNDLTLAQMAVIAGLPQAPSVLNPIHSPERARQRRNTVLWRMLDVGYISQQQYDEAREAPITGRYHGPEIELNAPYVAEMVRQFMVERYGEEAAYTSGFRVYTTVNSVRQQGANQAVFNNLINYDQRHGYRGPLANPWHQEQESSAAASDVPPPWSTEQITTYLDNFKTFHTLMPAFVTSVNDQGADIVVKNGNHGRITWDDMKWARRYVDDNHQGPAPKAPEDIVREGDVVMVSADQEQHYQLSQIPEADSAMVALRPADGAIEALVGGFSFRQSQYNRVIQAKRQIGSNIKPFIYSTAFANGYTLASLVANTPINSWDPGQGIAWRPKNSPEIYTGDTRLRRGLAQSINVMSVRLLRQLGMKTVRHHLMKFGFAPEDIPPNESLALGATSLAPIDVVRGFATFANGGFLVTPYLITRVDDPLGNPVYQAAPQIACADCSSKTVDNPQDTFKLCPASPIAQAQRAKQVISAQNAFLVTQAMNSVIWGGGSWSAGTGWNGTGWRAIAGLHHRHDIAGKTGTTNDSRDAWFSGFGPHIVATTWIGFDDHRRELGGTRYNANLGKHQTTGKEAGAKTAQPAWISFMQVALADEPEQPFTPPAGIVTARIDRKTGLLSRSSGPSSRWEYFIDGSQPTKYVESKSNSLDLFEQSGDISFSTTQKATEPAQSEQDPEQNDDDEPDHEIF